MTATDDEKCFGCSMVLIEPYIFCAECKPVVNICLKCFSKGSEFYNHTSDHSYGVKTMKFSLFSDEKWSARDEIKLLDAIEDQGFGNWKEISKKITNKSHNECRLHYLRFYVDPSVSHQALPRFEVNTEQCYRRPLIVKANKDVPRPNFNEPGDLLCGVGYMPARGDFLTEYDNYAEVDIKEVNFEKDDDDDDLIKELNLAMTEIYQTRLHDRGRRKSIMADYGLLRNSSTSDLFHYHEFGKSEKILRDHFKKFAQLLYPEEHEKIIQSILYEQYLMTRIKSLQEYRSHGLKNFRAADLYEKLKKKRKQNKRKFTRLDEVLLHVQNPDACRVWLQKQINGKNGPVHMPSMPMTYRKPVEPLDITGTACYEQLTEEERTLCSTLRLLPKTYLSYRACLEKASKTANGIRLIDARTILKIDVNKTKKLYSFFLEKGFIKSSSDA